MARFRALSGPSKYAICCVLDLQESQIQAFETEFFYALEQVQFKNSPTFRHCNPARATVRIIPSCLPLAARGGCASSLLSLPHFGVA